MLEVIRDYLSRYILDEYQFECDLPNSQYVFIRDTFCSVLRPDICVKARRVYLIELTVPYDERLEEASMRKTDKYQDLHKEKSLCGFNVTLKTIEVGSRGVLDSSSFSIFKDICSVSNKSIIELQTSSMSEGYMLLLRNLVEEKLKGLVLIVDTNLTVIFCSRLQVFNMRRCLVYNVGMTCQFLPCCK